MNEIFDVYTLIFLVAAVVIFIRLRNVLGTKTGSERRWDQVSQRDGRDRGEGVAEAGQQRSDRQDHAEHGDTVIPLPGTQSQQFGEATLTRTEEDIEEALSKHASPDSPLYASLKKIVAEERDFDPEGFIKGARVAYEMIVTSFAEGNRKLLKQLLSADVLEGFTAAIKARESRGESIDSSFVGIEKAQIVDAQLRDKTAHITVKFISSLITATLNSDGTVIDGDPKKVRRVTDIWTFARKLSSRDPNWKLVATESAN